MNKKLLSVCLLVSGIALFFAGRSSAQLEQYPIMNQIADRIIQKYQTATCEQLWEERAQKGKKQLPPMEQEAIQMLKENPQMRAAFISKIAAPIANKMFDCGMIP